MAHIVKTVFSLFLALLASASVFGEEIGTIHIVTPSWEGHTNEDGTGLFFDIVRSVYEPVGIKMEYEFVPWKRAEHMVADNEADAMLCVVEQNISTDMLSPRYPMVVEYTAAVFKKEKIQEWKGIESLADKHLVWLRGYDYHKNPLLKDIRFKWDEVDKAFSAWGRMENDREADIYIDSVVDIRNYIRTNNIDMTPYRMEDLWGENAYMAFAKSEKSEKLIEIYDRRIIELFKAGELKKLFEKWDLYPYPPEAWEE